MLGYLLQCFSQRGIIYCKRCIVYDLPADIGLLLIMIIFCVINLMIYLMYNLKSLQVVTKHDKID